MVQSEGIDKMCIM